MKVFRYWCHEGCGWVDSNHRCEQWASVSMVPEEAIKDIVEKERERCALQVDHYVSGRLSEIEDLKNAIRQGDRK